jgi:DNA polymerase III epsilon subunit family exonuclease
MNWEDAFWIVDVEGNGASPPEIVELAMAEIRAMVPTGIRKHWLIRPETPISPMVTRIHGIHNDDVADAPTFEEIADDVLTWLQDASIIGHNVKVDLDALKRALPGWEPKAAIDTLRLAKIIKPGLPSYGLANLSDKLGLEPSWTGDQRTGLHSAPFDAAITATLFATLLADVPNGERSRLLQEADVMEKQRGFEL